MSIILLIQDLQKSGCFRIVDIFEIILLNSELMFSKSIYTAVKDVILLRRSNLIEWVILPKVHIPMKNTIHTQTSLFY